MPYLTEERKREIDAGDPPMNGGELNYKITTVLVEYVRNQMRENQGAARYQFFNDVSGSAVNAVLEFYRRVTVAYEDAKIEQNGDVYDRLLDEMGLLEVQPFRLPPDSHPG